MAASCTSDANGGVFFNRPSAARLMRARCPKCQAVFEVKASPSLVHLGPWRFTKCPACGKSSMTNNFVSDAVTWPPDSADRGKAPSLTDEELRQKRLEESKFEEREG